ncbi:gamma-1-syntrophin isoform X5 [Aquila chrysaetos chrysaetos]|uniref:gamma-1-syntrophin isoform X5 n=1 Tax=Aquila chrysaetos chrysaetos TaxID=223781 RepID=UPI001177317F|nr:gamma-1-syntrophin isoform X5 [Aquila chrysaetos chrysaetos]
MDFRTACEETKTGICLLQDGNQEPFKVRLHLAKDILMIQEQDVICVSGEPFYSGERTVTIRRQTVGGFGLSIKGGAEHNIPVVISKISKEQRAELSGLLFIGDAILQVICSVEEEEERRMDSIYFSVVSSVGLFQPDTWRFPDGPPHTSQPLVWYSMVQVLRNAGEEVTLTVSFLKRAPAFLKLPLNEDCACAPSDQSSGTSSPLCDSGLHLNYHPNNTDTLSCSSWPASPGLRWEKRWCDLRLIPLLHSRFSQYLPGSDLCRQNAFQVIAVDGVCSGIIQCLSAEDCIDWLQAIASNISNLTKHNIKKINRNFPVNQQIVYMGWTEEREQDSLQDRMYTPKFLALRGSSLYKFIAPPCKTYACVLESHLMGLTIDFSMGFVCFDAATKAVLWRYKFSQLKGSSDDGKSKIKFLFQNQDTKQIEAKELEFSNLFAVLHCIHSFFAAKVACLDPLYVGSQATASAAPTTSGTGKLKYTT